MRLLDVLKAPVKLVGFIPNGFRHLRAPLAGDGRMKVDKRRATSARAMTDVQVPLSADTLSPNVLKAQYAVRGDIVAKAKIIADDLASGKGSYPFSNVLNCNIGNPQRLDQKPISYFRQVLALCEYPQMMENPNVTSIFPEDVCERAKTILKAIPGGVGAYSESPGVPFLRKLVAEAVERRDGCPCAADDIFMLEGASGAVHSMMLMLLRPQMNDALMVPIPQYPLYSATLSLYGGSLVPYLLDEEQGWQLHMGLLREALAAARQQGQAVRGLVVINPGNPTGQVLNYANQVDIVRFCAEEQLVLIADEVYQTNVYDPTKTFNSFKKVAFDLGLVGQFPLVALHSISKGFVGECGRRGGFMEVTGFPQGVRDQLFKLISINLCPNVSGQICCALMMNPPAPGEPSHDLYCREREAILASLKRRAVFLVESLNALQGVRCNTAEGALYAFPNITLPPRAVEAAKARGKSADWLYCMELLESTGIVVVPGSGFGQRDGSYHFRTTFLPSEQDIGSVVDRLSTFHASFMAKYA